MRHSKSYYPKYVLQKWLYSVHSIDLKATVLGHGNHLTKDSRDMQVNPSVNEDNAHGGESSRGTFTGEQPNLSIDGALLKSPGYPYQAEGSAQGSHDARAQYATQTAHEAQMKPAVGTEEWYKVRKGNHKEVERRRREAINKGIDGLAKVVPNCDKHKGQILMRAVEYINKLKENEHQYMEKLTLEKLLAEQAISELSNTNKALKGELAQAWKEVEHWKTQVLNKSK